MSGVGVAGSSWSPWWVTALLAPCGSDAGTAGPEAGVTVAEVQEADAAVEVLPA